MSIQERNFSLIIPKGTIKQTSSIRMSDEDVDFPVTFCIWTCMLAYPNTYKLQQCYELCLVANVCGV